MGALTLSIKCFGVFRQFGDQVSINIAAGSSVQQIKETLAQQLGDQHKTLIAESVLANDNEVLPNSYIIQGETALVILPPVCGG